jgi:DNA-binding PadR family transcriptional regulator
VGLPEIGPLHPGELLSGAARSAVAELSFWVNELLDAWELYLRSGGFPRAIGDLLRTGDVTDGFVQDLWDVIRGDAIRATSLGDADLLNLLARIAEGISSPLNASAIGRDVGLGSHHSVNDLVIVLQRPSRESKQVRYDSAAMSALISGDPTPRMMVLGLVVQEPDSVAGVARRLADQFASARFPKTSAHNNLPSLARDGYVRLVRRGEKASLDRYEATVKGVELLRGWLRRTELPPAIRDVVQCKLELLQREDLAALVEIMREEEDAYTSAHDIAHSRMLREQRSRRARGGPGDWQTRLRAVQTKDEANLWGLMSQRLERLREELEALLDEISRGAVDGG